MIKGKFLSQEDQRELELCARDGASPHRYGRRVNAILLLDKGMQPTQYLTAVLRHWDHVIMFYYVFGVLLGDISGEPSGQQKFCRTMCREFFNKRPNRALLRSCRRCEIPNIFLAEIDNIHIARKGIRAADGVIYASKAIFEAINTHILWGVSADPKILSQPNDLDLLSDELVKIIKVVHLSIEQRQRDIKFLSA